MRSQYFYMRGSILYGILQHLLRVLHGRYGQIGPANIVLAFLSAWAIGSSVATAVCAYTPLPYFDSWSLYDPLLYNWRFLTSQHNEHRILTTKLAFFADLKFFNGQGLIPYILVFFAQAITCVLVFRLVRCNYGNSSRLNVRLFFATWVCMFSAIQFTNFTWPFQMAFVGVYALIIGALYACVLSSYSQRALGGYFWVACGLVATATYTMANGLLGWLVFLALMVWLRRPWTEIAAVSISTVVFFVLYLHNYKTPNHSANPLESVKQIRDIALFASAWLGSPVAELLDFRYLGWNPLSSDQRSVVAAAVGLIGMGIFVSTVFRLLIVQRSKVISSEKALTALSSFIILSGLVTALGRLNLPLVEATSSRYTTPALIFWTIIVLKIFRGIERGSHRHSVIAGLIAVSMGIWIGANQPVRLKQAEIASLRFREAELAMVAGVFDKSVWGYVYPRPEEIRDNVNHLHIDGLSLFAAAWPHWIGRSLSGSFRVVSGGEYLGSFDGAVTFDNNKGLRASGWAFVPNLKEPPEFIMIADESGDIIGIGRTGWSRPDVVRHFRGVVTGKPGWVAYAKPLSQCPVKAYALIPGTRSVFALAGPGA